MGSGTGAPSELSRVRDLPELLAGDLATHVARTSALTTQARTAFVSALRAYRTFPRELRAAFPYDQLHTGHLAASFALREAPREASKRDRQQHGPQKSRGVGRGRGVPRGPDRRRAMGARGHGAALRHGRASGSSFEFA